MKKTYEKPRMEVTEFRFSEHIAASGGTGGGTATHCRWGKYITDVGVDCDSNIVSGWINNAS